MSSLLKKIFDEIPDGLDETWYHGALVGGPADSFDLAESYRLAADLLVEHVLTRKHEAWELVYPIMFNYRHCLELYLKMIVTPGKHRHSLQGLLTNLTRYVKDTHHQAVPKWFKDAVLELHDFDEKSTTFRYSDVGIQSKKREDGEYWVDLAEFQKLMKSVVLGMRNVIFAKES